MYEYFSKPFSLKLFSVTPNLLEKKPDDFPLFHSKCGCAFSALSIQQFFHLVKFEQ